MHMSSDYEPCVGSPFSTDLWLADQEGQGMLSVWVLCCMGSQTTDTYMDIETVAIATTTNVQ